MSNDHGRAFDHVVIIMFENEYRNYVRRNAYMASLATAGIDLRGYSGVMHPSNTNYVASVAGEICNISEDPVYCTLMPGAPPPSNNQALSQTPIVDRIRDKGLTWGAYFETYQRPEFPPLLTPVMDGSTVDQIATSKRTILDGIPYINAHNPFVRFSSITGNREQWDRLGTLNDFISDCLDNTLPEYSWISPNLWSDGHWLFASYTEPPERGISLVDQLSHWLEGFFRVLNFPGPNSRIPPRTLVVVTFDEADFDQNYETLEAWDGTYDGPNQVYTVLLGDGIEPGIEVEGYNHYSLLKTIEKNFGLGDLGKNDAESNWFQFLWKRRFSWSAPRATAITAADTLAAAELDGALFVVWSQLGTLSCSSMRDGSWKSEPPPRAVTGLTAIGLAACGDQLLLVCAAGGALSCMTFDGKTWSQPAPVASSVTGAFSVASFFDYGAGAQKVLLAYVVSGNAIQSQTYAAGTWGAAVPLTQQTDGDLQLAVLGPSIFLIHKAVGSQQMNVVSYNTAPFNVVNSAGVSNTTQYAWSPSEWPVASFAFGPSRATPRDPEPQLAAYLGAAPFAAATLDGVIHLAHPSAGGPEVVSETFSMSGILTAQNPVSYSQAESSTDSNGYGTLAEAGWTEQVPIAGVSNAGAMVMTKYGQRLVLLFQPTAGGAVQVATGEYA